MKYLTIEKLPIGVYFWRKNHGARYYKISSNEMVPFDHPALVERIENSDEIILSDPNWCSDCWRELNWPLEGVCQYCHSNKQKKLSFEEIKHQLIEWTNNPDVHI